MSGSESVVDPAARDKYLLQVTTGPSYDPSTHDQVSVNGQDAAHIDSDIVSAWIHVRIRDYHGLPKNSPSTSPYFSHKLHTSDRYSIAYSFVPKQDISGADLVMGFDYSHSVKHQLPPGTKYAMKIVTSLLDPGLYSDPYSDEPYLYGPALSSWFAFGIGERVEQSPAEKQIQELEAKENGVVEEGAFGTGSSIRQDSGMPSKWKKRRKYFLDAEALTNFTFEKGRMYHADFFNPHLDFANFSLRLPGFSISVARYVDEKTHHLRYVLKNRRTGEVLFVVIFKLLFGKELEETLAEDKGKSRKESEAGTTKEANTDQQNYNGEEIPQRQESTKSDAMPASESRIAMANAEENEAEQEKQGIVGSATSAATDLANSIYAVYAALGFVNSSSSSDSESQSRNSENSPQPSSRSMHAQIDDMDDATVEQYLQTQHSKV